MKHIVGLDLGTNSIGWASVMQDDQKCRINAAGSRIIPMSEKEMGAFMTGNTQSKAAQRRQKRSPRRMRERFLLRRERLIRILNILGFLPEHFKNSLGWDIINDKKHYATFLDSCETKLAWTRNADGMSHFLFESSFLEMVKEIQEQHPDIKCVPHDWTIYFLRKKALTSPITKEELAWIILQFNQKRGYALLRDEELTSSEGKQQKYEELVVSSVEEIEKSRKGARYRISFENSNIIYERESKYPLNWVGKTIGLVITTQLNEDGTPRLKKNGSIDYSISLPGEDSWKVKKLKTEQDLRSSGLTVGTFIYNKLLESPSTKIRGNYVHTIERDFYEEELKKILEKQQEFHSELTDRNLYVHCIADLYKHNESHRNAISRNNFIYLILEDVLYYQRHGGNNKALVAHCPYEYHQVVDHNDGEIINYPIKCIAMSNPIFQEFRIWKFINDLRIYKKSGIENGNYCEKEDVTTEYIRNDEDWASLFLWLKGKNSIKQDALLKHVGIDQDQLDKFRWSYVDDDSKAFPMNRTGYAFTRKLKKEERELWNDELEAALWHLLYSTTTMDEINKSLSPYNHKQGIYHKLQLAGLSDSTIESFKKIKFEDDGYASYSAKAIKKLLSVMRRGSLWSASRFDVGTLERINNIINGQGLSAFSEKVRNRLSNMSIIQDFSGLPEWLACYVVYGRHSEPSDIQKWNSPNDIDVFLHNFRQHSLNNPVVESVVCETMRVVRDIWKRYGTIDEFHIELSRDLKSPNDKRASMTAQNAVNEATNIRIKRLLAELSNPSYKVSNVRPNSPYQRELLRIYEEYVLTNTSSDEEIRNIQKTLSDITKEPSHSDFERYKCWLDQKYLSPYTGQVIPLSELFTEKYEIEHIIPQSIFIDNSFSNKVICEKEVNDLKGNLLGMEFIRRYGGGLVQLSGGRTVPILREEQYIELININYATKSTANKRRNLLLDEIPAEFTKRQQNDTRYISCLVMGLLSNIVREVDDDGNITEKTMISKNTITCNGFITQYLKQDWGMNEVWNQLILPRFRRLNSLVGQQLFTTITDNGHEIPTMPLGLLKGFKAKRIDHRHHALDAIVIACTTREHVNLLNNEYARPEHKEMRYALSHKLRRYEEVFINGKKRRVPKEFLMPWPTFKQDAFDALSSIVISYKSPLRILNKARNKYKKQGELTTQEGHDHYAIRKSLHKETFYGHVNLRRVKKVTLATALDDIHSVVDKALKAKIQELLSQDYNHEQIVEYFKAFAHEWKRLDIKKVPIYYFTDDAEPMVASRFGNTLIEIFSGMTDMARIEKRIEEITDTGIQKILFNYFQEHQYELEYATSPEGFEELNRNISHYNNEKRHQPIFKVRLSDKLGKKFAVGNNYNTQHKYVVADEGTNLYFAIYQDAKGQRIFRTIPLYEVITRLKMRLSPVDEITLEGYKLLFTLSPNDLVYVPTPDDQESAAVEDYQRDRIYRFVDSSGTTANFVPHTSASVIYHVDKKDAMKYCLDGIIQDEYGVGSPQSKNQKAITGEMIKEICIPIKVNRIGEIVP